MKLITLPQSCCYLHASVFVEPQHIHITTFHRGAQECNVNAVAARRFRRGEGERRKEQGVGFHRQKNTHGKCGPRTCLPVFHKLSTAIRGIPASMVKNTLRVLRQRQRVCTSFWSGLRGSNSLPGIPRIAFRNSQEPCLTSDPIALRAWVSVSSSFRLTKKSGHPNRMS